MNLGVWVCLGQVLPIIEAACGLHWYNICLIGIIFPTIGLLTIPFIPESPSWFVIKVGWDFIKSTCLSVCWKLTLKLNG